METVLLGLCFILLLILLFIVLTKNRGKGQEELLQAALREEMKSNREELNSSLQMVRQELNQSINQGMVQVQSTINKNQQLSSQLNMERFGQMAQQQQQLLQSTEKRLDAMRDMVEEKLQKTLNERINQSFEMVRKNLEQVQRGLGEMQSLAKDVGGLKKVLTNVKTRGTFGEVQLGALLEQIMSPEQYEANVKPRPRATEFVEYAIKLPGKNDGVDLIYLPIDAKFPKDVYEQYYDAYQAGDTVAIEISGKQLEKTIKSMAKDISEKYIEPPYTTDFGIMFLPFENIYAEVIRRTALVEELQRKYKVMVTGPTTLGAILNSLQMGFRTLAIQKRSSEIWTILGAVKSEFNNFDKMLQKVQTNINQANKNLDEVIGVRTRQIQRKLKEVEELPIEEASKYFPSDEMS